MNMRKTMSRTCRRQHGLTLVEVMVAAAVGLLLTAGAIQIFVSSKQAYRTTDAMSRIQENGRYGLQFLARDIRGASFWGCAQDVEVNNVVDDGGVGFDFDGEPIEGTEGSSGAPDSVTLRMAGPNSGVSVNKKMPNTAANLFLTHSDGIEEGDIMIVTDCESADIFMVTGNNTNNDNVQHNSGNEINGISNTTQEFSKSYGVGSMAYSAMERTYSINNGTLERTTNDVTEVLVDGVEDMQITYGIDDDADFTVNQYVRADQVANWSDAVAVRISLLVRGSEDNVLDVSQEYAYNGATVTAADNRLRQVFTKTVGVRNRLE